MVTNVRRIGVLLLFALGLGACVLLPLAAAEQAAGSPSTAASTPAAATEPLNGTWWAIELEPLYTTAASPTLLKDTLVFKNGKVASALLAEEAFPSAPFTVSVRDGIPAWEATHASQRGGIIFWHGEVDGEGHMRGTFSRHPLDGASVFCTFTGHQMTDTEQAQAAPVSETAKP